MKSILNIFNQRLYPKSPALLQDLMVTLYGAKIHWERFGEKFKRKMEEFERNEWSSYEELVQYQNEKLRRLIEHAYENVPYYHRKMAELKLRPEDIKSVEDLPKLPTLKREDIRKNFWELKAKNYSLRDLRMGHTSGSTGSPLQFLWDKNICLITNVVDWRQKIWAGLKYRDKIALLLGRIVVPLTHKNPPFWRINLVHRQLFMSSFHLKIGNLEHYVQKLNDFKPQTLEAYPSTAYVLARYLNQRNQCFPLTCVLTTSETLFPHYREAIQKAFSCPVFDFYGMAERVVFASECSAHQGHHLNMDYGITELIKKDNQPASRGEMGRIVATGLYNYGMPLIRYETSDVTALKKQECSCGRKFPLIEDITTRAEDFIITRDGRYISPIVLQHPFKPMKTVIESQIIQEDKENITIKIVKDNGYTEKDTQYLLDEFHKRLGPNMKMDIQFVESIPRTEAGKLKWVISKVPMEF